MVIKCNEPMESTFAGTAWSGWDQKRVKDQNEVSAESIEKEISMEKLTPKLINE